MTPRTKKNWLDFEAARGWVHKLELSSFREWREYVTIGIDGKPTLPEDIPKSPDKVYIDDWDGYSDWLGTDLKSDEKFVSEHFSEPPNYESYHIIAEKVKKFHYKSPAMYRNSVRKRKKSLRNKLAHGGNISENLKIIGSLPINPERIFDEWTSWGDFLGLSNKEIKALEWFPENLQKLKSKYGYTNAELARKIGTSSRSLNRYVIGESLPPDDIQFKIKTLVSHHSLEDKKTAIDTSIADMKKKLNYLKETSSNTTLFLEETTNSKTILNAVKNMEIRIAHNFSNQEEINLGQAFFELVFDYKKLIQKQKDHLNHIDTQKELMVEEFNLSKIILKLSELSIVKREQITYDDGHNYIVDNPLGIFIYSKGGMIVPEIGFSPCLLIYIGPIKDERVKNRGKHGTNIELDITEFGIDPEKEGWNTIYLKKIKWKCDDCQISWIIAEKIKDYFTCPVCFSWDKKKNKGSLSGITGNPDKKYWWKCIEGKNHCFKMSWTAFKDQLGACVICNKNRESS